MANIQKSNSKALIPAPKRDMIVTEDKQSFKRFLQVYESIGGEVNEVTIHLMKRSIEENRITVDKIERAVIQAFNECKYKPKWSDIMNFLHEAPLPEYLTTRLDKKEQHKVFDGGTWTKEDAEKNRKTSLKRFEDFKKNKKLTSTN